MVRNVYTRMVSPKLGYLVNLTGHNIKGKLQDSCLLSIVSSKQLNSLQLLLLRVILTVYVVHVRSSCVCHSKSSSLLWRPQKFVIAVTTSKVRHSSDELKSSSQQWRPTCNHIKLCWFSEAVMAIYPTTTEETVQCQLRNILSNKKQRYEKSLPGYVPPKRVRKRKVDLCTKYV